jgi:predicted phage-related endonuclease
MVGKLTPDNMISASRIPVLLGLSPYQTQNELLSEMIQRDAGSYQSTFDGNEITQWGDRLEPVILNEAAKRLGLRNHEIHITKPEFHPDLPLAASLDGLGVANRTIKTDAANGIYCMTADEIDISTIGVLEAKATSAMPEEMPAAHRGLWQLQAQMMCGGYKWGAICVLYRGIEMRIFVYEADAVMQKRIEDAILNFEKRRKTGDVYPVLTSDDGNAAYPYAEPDADPLDLNDQPDALTAFEDLMLAKEAKRQAEADIDMAEATIKEYMGNHDQAHINIGLSRYQIKWPMRRTKAQPEKVVPAKPEATVRQKTLSIKEL